MKNAIVFSIDKRLMAIELRWVREVITLGHVTPVPNAPPVIAGVVNFGGAIIPCIELAKMSEPSAEPRIACRGESAILVQVESVRAAIRVDAVVEVATLSHVAGDRWRDKNEVEARLLEPQELIADARAQVAETPVLGGRSEGA
jgi:chemotaxis signal transduction protein